MNQALKSYAKYVDLNKTILVIDDDPDYQLIIGNMLRSNGYKVEFLLDGNIGPATAMAKKCDMVLLDIEMPETNGVDVAAQLKANPLTKEIPIILISAHLEGDKLFKSSKANGFMHKPFLLPWLLKKILALLQERSNLKIDPELRF
ncbi:MAG TPA: response regulator [Cyclobacteriaceae bacterium]